MRIWLYTRTHSPPAHTQNLNEEKLFFFACMCQLIVIWGIGIFVFLFIKFYKFNESHTFFCVVYKANVIIFKKKWIHINKFRFVFWKPTMRDIKICFAFELWLSAFHKCMRNNNNNNNWSRDLHVININYGQTK